MDTNHSTIGKSDEQVIWSLSSSDDQLGCTSSVRSYTCAFCKKGFSNAQALGGHMNIHRRDRAKLRESFDETKSINPPHDHHPLPDQASHQGKNPFPLESVEEGSRIPKSPQSLSLGDSADKDLPFSMDSKMCNFHDGDDDYNKLKLSQRTIQTELDLELRLGPEPHEISSSSSTRSTRGFF